MTTNLEALLERATKRPWDCGSSADGQLTEIAVNHFEEAIRTLRHIVHTKHFRENMESGEAFAEVSRLAYDAAVKLLAKIEAAAKGE